MSVLPQDERRRHPRVPVQVVDNDSQYGDFAAASVVRHGLGYRGLFPGGIHLHLARLHSSRGDLSGMLSVRHGERVLYKGRFNVASVSARSTLIRYLKDRGAYDGWGVVLEKFCWHVLTIDEEGPSTSVIGQQPRRGAPAYQVESVLPKNQATIIAGPGGSFKSTLAAAFAVSVQTGVAVVEGWFPEQGNVLVLDWESDEEEWNDRVVGIATGMGIEAPGIRYRRCAHRLTALTESIADQVAREDIALLIVDSVGLAQGTSGDGGDANESTLGLFEALRSIGCTSLLIDHVRGDELGNSKVSAKPYGSVYKVNLARSIFELRREDQPSYPEATQVLLRHTKVNSGPKLKPQGLRIIHGETSILFERCVIDAPDLEQHAGTTVDRMRRLLGRSGELDESDLAETLGVSRSAIRQTMTRHQGFQRNPDGKIGLVVL